MDILRDLNTAKGKREMQKQAQRLASAMSNLKEHPAYPELIKELENGRSYS